MQSSYKQSFKLLTDFLKILTVPVLSSGMILTFSMATLSWLLQGKEEFWYCLCTSASYAVVMMIMLYMIGLGYWICEHKELFEE